MVGFRSQASERRTFSRARVSSADDLNLSGDFSCANATIRGQLNAMITIPSVATDGTTISGDGTLLQPLAVIPAGLAGAVASAHDATLIGDGTTGNPLGVNVPALDGNVAIARDATLVGDGQTATPLGVNLGNVPIVRDASLVGDGTLALPLGVNVPALDGNVAVATDATLTGDGKTATSLSVASAPTGSTAIAHDATLTGDGKTATPLSVVATTFAAATPARALNSTFAPSATRYVMVVYSVQVALTAGQDGTCELRCDAASPPVTVQSSMRGACSGLIGDTNTMRSPLVFVVPPGHNVRLVTSGTGTFTLSNQTEITITG